MTTTIASGAIATASSAVWCVKRSTVENIVIPSTTSASTLSSVCETIVPSTTGRCSRALPIRRATTNARAGSPRRAGSVADMSTPMNVPCSASTSRTRARGSAARRIACHAAPRSTIEKHMSPSATSTHVGVAASRDSPIRSMPMRCSAKPANSAASSAASAMPARRTRRAAGRGAPPSQAGSGSSVGSRTAGTRTPSAGV